MKIKHIRERINQNIKRFKENVDFIDLKQRVGQTGTLELLQELGYSKQSITQAEHIYILSERGYAKLIKIMDTDLAWEIHDRLIDEYFQCRKLQANISDLSPELRLLINMELHQKQQDEKILAMQDNMKKLEAKVTTHNDDYYTITGYAKLNNLTVDKNMARKLGKNATKLSRKKSYPISDIHDERYGTVHTYHIDILQEVFSNAKLIPNTANKNR